VLKGLVLIVLPVTFKSLNFNIMVGTEKCPQQLSYLIDIVRRETNTPKHSFIKLESVTSGARFNKHCKSPFWDTSNVFVYVNNRKYNVTKKKKKKEQLKVLILDRVVVWNGLLIFSLIKLKERLQTK
jgi:hypothetical protein